MKISKIITLNFIFVAFALLHVFLQTEITKLGYQVKNNEDKCQEIVDSNYVLKYNIYALESPGNLDKYVLLKNSNLKMLKPVQVVGLSSESAPVYLRKKEDGSLLSNNSVFLVLKRLVSPKQAEAKTIK
ncbi:MAG: hypothetical protein PHG69_02030 [Candidatus Omnitrophica bacterium]|nr:hypothetical protein [Candidatus Omnitrophota bacterium]